MINQDINDVTVSIRAIERGDKELAAAYLHRVKMGTRNRRMRDLVYALICLHDLTPHIRTLLKEREEYRKRITAENRQEI
jgi:hypothetical protein